MNPQNYTINIRPGWGISPVVKVSQGDVGRPLAFTIMDGQDALTIASGTTVTIKGTKPSTLGFTQTCELSGNTASVETTATMTQEAGAVQAELILTQGTTIIGSANFVMYVEPAAHPEGTTDGDAETARDLMTRAQAAVEQAEAEADRAEDAAESVSQTGISTVGATAGQVPTANGAGGWSWQDQQGGGGTSDDIENKSSVSGATVTDALNSLSGEIANKLTTAQINALNGMFQVCAYAEDATAEYATFCEAFGLATLTSITAVYTQSGLVYDTDTLDSLKSDLVVTAHYSDSTTETLASSAYTLSGTLSAGTSTITVSYGGKTTAFSVTVEDQTAYVTDGLFAYWDAIDNQATGQHDTTATTWIDLVNGYTWTAMKTDGSQTWEWSSNALNFNTPGGSSGTNGKNTFQCARPGTALRTLEVVFTPADVLGCVGEFTSDLTGITDNTTQILGVFPSDDTVTSIGVQNGYEVTDITSIKSITATYNVSSAAVKLYKNSEEITSRGSSRSFKYHHYSDMILGAQNSSGGNLTYGFKGIIHAIRMYDRELTAAEIAHNYALDVQRFGLS